jgi:hypothetical protein
VPEADLVVATYFHYNDVRRRWPRLLASVRFLTLRVDPDALEWLGDAEAAVVLERDEPTAGAVVADLRAALRHPVDLSSVVTSDPAGWVARERETRVLVSPRVWSDLGAAERALEHCAVVGYRFDEGEIDALARERGWRRAEDRHEDD